MDNRLITDAIHAAAVSILILDEADRILYCSKAAAQLLGFEPSELIGKLACGFVSLTPASHPKDASDPALYHTTETHKIGRGKANHTVVLAVTVDRWVDALGNARSTVLMRDATADRENDKIRQRDLIQSDNAIRGANIGVFEFEVATQSVQVSGIWLKMLEIDPDEDIDLQLEWRSRVHPEDIAIAVEPVDLCIAGVAERASCEYRLRSRDNTSWRWMRTDIAVAYRDADGKAAMLVGAQTDITYRKMMEETLRLAIEQFRSAFENAPIGMAIVGLEGEWLQVNPALCNLLGYSTDAFLRTNFQALTHPDDLEADIQAMHGLLEGQIQTYSVEKRYYRANGAVMWGKLRVSLVRNAAGQPDHFVTQIVDVTEQRRLDEAKTEFVSVVSHELRTPLTAILGALELLQSDDDSDFPDQVQRLLYIAKTNGDRLHHLIDDILDFQKFSARKMRFSLAPISVAQLIEDALLANLASADKYGVQFSTMFLDRSLIALVDSKRFQQIMANLLSNACKFAFAGSTIEVSAERQGQAIRVCVSNRGAGIPETFKARVFRPFSQAGSLSSLRSGGTGLGLSITKQIVEQMGGQIGFDSVPDQTTRFWFTVESGPAE